MSQWDTSALVKLYAMEADSAQFQGLTAPGVPLAVARIARYEAHAAFRRREAEGSLPQGETAVLRQEISEAVYAFLDSECRALGVTQEEIEKWRGDA